ncbi:hypothetical protein [Nitratidesulfovibrio liaohensis]|uniref:hypothetical protein n=1 Tax=Nitratidesulfovibrio liaohensis TaxID=2604158 RepID=UPI00141DF5C9|nr:hypothetical protein [Nitratidesulfovibrio liaohensis]NHZ46297.1 hypothetical protein [Nitratidesulfovibrio liaohensis]
MYLEEKNNELIGYQKRIDNNEINNIDDANYINTREKEFPVEYIVYKLRVEANIAKSVSSKRRLEKYCSNYAVLITLEEDYINNLDRYNKKIAEKFIAPDMYISPTEEDIRKALVAYLIELSMIYGFKDPDSIVLKIDDIIPYKSYGDHIGFICRGYYNAKNGFGAYTGYKPVRLVYLDGKMKKFDQPDDLYSSDVVAFCRGK